MDFYLNKHLILDAKSKKPKISLIGIPFDGTQIEFPGSRFGPNKIRETILHTYTTDAEKNIAIFDYLEDLGNINIVHGDTQETMKTIIKFMEKFNEQRTSYPIFLGGDHSITYGILKGLQKKHKKIDLIIFDAHADCIDSFNGEKLGHINYLYNLIKEKIIDNVTVIGARAYSKEELEIAKKLKIKFLKESQINSKNLKTKNPCYVSIDLDVLDFNLAIGTGTPELDGPDIYFVIEMLDEIIANNKIIGLDLVELNPMLKESRITEYSAAYILRQIMFDLIEKKN
jgi:agmatinase